MRRDLLVLPLLLLCGLLRLAPAVGAIAPLDSAGFYHVRMTMAVQDDLVVGLTSPYPLFHLLLGLMSRVMDLDALVVVRLVPAILASMGVVTLYVCVRDLASFRAALLAAFFYTTTPLLIQTSYGPFSLVHLFLPLMARELVRQRSKRAIGVLTFALAATGGFAVWLAVFVVYSFTFGYGIHRLQVVRRAVAIGLVPVALMAWFAGTLVPESSTVVPGHADIGIPSVGVGLLFLLLFLESFEEGPRLARFLIILAGTCFFGYLLGRAFQLDFLVTFAVAVVMMEAIGAHFFIGRGTAVIYRATAMVAILAFALLHAWNVSDAIRPDLTYEEYTAARGMTGLTADAVVLSDEVNMELLATVSPVNVMLTREVFDRKRWTDFHLLMATNNITCSLVRRHNITHVFLSSRVQSRFPYALKYSGLPTVADHRISDNLKLVEIKSYCQHRV